MLNPKQCVLYSGGAAGTEQFFGALAEGWGIEEVNYSFGGRTLRVNEAKPRAPRPPRY